MQDELLSDDSEVPVKIRLTFKTPDVLDQVLDGLDASAKYHIKRVADKWVEYGEYITVELDLINGTCTVLPVGE